MPNGDASGSDKSFNPENFSLNQLAFREEEGKMKKQVQEEVQLLRGILQIGYNCSTMTHFYLHVSSKRLTESSKKDVPFLANCSKIFKCCKSFKWLFTAPF